MMKNTTVQEVLTNLAHTYLQGPLLADPEWSLLSMRTLQPEHPQAVDLLCRRPRFLIVNYLNHIQAHRLEDQDRPTGTGNVIIVTERFVLLASLSLLHFSRLENSLQVYSVSE